MIIAIPKETKFKENRVALVPLVVKDLVAKGFSVNIEAGAGLNSFFSDDDYVKAGAAIVADKNSIYNTADVVLKVNAPLPDEIALMKKEAILISFMWAGTNPERHWSEVGLMAFICPRTPNGTSAISDLPRCDILAL